MPLSPQERDSRCLAMFGMSALDWDAYKASAMRAGFNLPNAGRQAAMSILSDVQETLEWIGPERESLREKARVMINRAKALMSEDPITPGPQN